MTERFYVYFLFCDMFRRINLVHQAAHTMAVGVCLHVYLCCEACMHDIARQF